MNAQAKERKEPSVCSVRVAKLPRQVHIRPTFVIKDGLDGDILRQRVREGQERQRGEREVAERKDQRLSGHFICTN